MPNTRKTKKFWEPFFYSFPIQLLINHIKRNQVMLFCWFILFMIITGNFGRYLGIPFLFLDPEYLNDVSFWAFLIMGFVIAGFSIAFQITTYIIDGARFPFLGVLPKPFLRFSINNYTIPGAFLIIYLYQLIKFQIHYEFASSSTIALYVTGVLAGYLFMLISMFLYFRLTNKDIFKYLAESFNEQLKSKIRATRAKVMSKMSMAKRHEIRVDNYLDTRMRILKTPEEHRFDTDTITKVFDQNHLNLVIIELLIFLLLLVMGILREYPILQLPAAASFVLFLTIIVMFIGAFSYWFHRWAVSIAIGILIVINFLVKQEIFANKYKAFGLTYETEVLYNTKIIRELNTKEINEYDKKNTLKILENWRNKFPEDNPPKALFVCTSGGGQRASLWTMRVMQEATQASKGAFFDHNILITGASGGIIGASYYRELQLQNSLGNITDPLDPKYLEDISKDNLNPLIFSFLVNDLFVKFQSFEYNGFKYPKDRGYSFEEQINKNTKGLMDKPLKDYMIPEQNAQIPMIILGPTIINDGRKLFISPQNVSYMNILEENQDRVDTPESIDFLRFYKDQGSEDLRFLSALRMNATFPYITPNITLPSKPAMEIMDAGISDNFGIADAVRFVFVFKDWLEANTSGIVIVSIRDSESDRPVSSLASKSLINKFSKPISSIYANFENLQEISNSNKITFARSWFGGKLNRIDFQYIPQSFTGKEEDIERASLSWRLTTREKEDIKRSINSPQNQQALQELIEILKE